MKVKLLTSRAVQLGKGSNKTDESQKVGDTIEVTEAEGRRLIEQGQAEAIGAKKKTAKKKAAKATKKKATKKTPAKRATKKKAAA